MRIIKQPCLKLKAVLQSVDGGRSWIVTRQHYLTDLDTNLLLDDSMQGILLTQKETQNGKPEPFNHS